MGTNKMGCAAGGISVGSVDSVAITGGAEGPAQFPEEPKELVLLSASAGPGPLLTSKPSLRGDSVATAGRP